MIRVNIVRLCLNYLHVPILSGVFWLVRWRAAIEEYIWLFPKEWSENVLLHISLVVKVLDPHNQDHSLVVQCLAQVAEVQCLENSFHHLRFPIQPTQ